jgi:hypothetical protein
MVFQGVRKLIPPLGKSAIRKLIPCFESPEFRLWPPRNAAGIDVENFT